MIQKIYCERSGGRWEYWTYVNGQRVYLREAEANRLLKIGFRLVEVK